MTDSGRVIAFGDRPRARRRPRRGGTSIAFGVELPERGDVVFAVTALTQLITIADQSGIDGAGPLRAAIDDLRRRLEGARVDLPPHLDALLEQLSDESAAEVISLADRPTPSRP
jgi:hypothetical protein